MADRAPRRNNPAIPRNASTSLDPPGSRPAASSSTSTSVRRNLFPQAGGGARRQLRHHDATSSSSTSTVRHNEGNTSNDSANNDIIVRDHNGSFLIDAPQVPLPQEATLEDEEQEARRRMIEGWRKLGDGMVDQNGEFDDFPNLQARQVYLSVVYHAITVANWRLMRGCTEWTRRVADRTLLDSEIRAVLLASLEEQLQSLDDDGWMFGDEEKEEDQ